MSSSNPSSPPDIDPSLSRLYSGTSTYEIAAGATAVYDRDIDVFVEESSVFDALTIFKKSLPGLELNEQRPLFLDQLTMVERFRIYDLVFDVPVTRPITLSRNFATQFAFPDNHFVTYAEVLKPARGISRACVRTREEIMNYVWTRYRFHVSLSHYTGPNTSALSQKFLKIYGNTVQRLTIELDLSRLGFGPYPDSALLKADPTKVRNLFNDIVTWLREEGRYGKIAELHLMCRRYKGDRPAATLPRSVDAPMPYCSEAAMEVFLPIVKTLRGDVVKVRFSGFSQSFTDAAIFALFGPAARVQVPEDPAWPPTGIWNPQEGIAIPESALPRVLQTFQEAEKENNKTMSRQERRELERKIKKNLKKYR